MEIRSDCPTGCMYISGGKCVANECYKNSFQSRFATALKVDTLSTTITIDDLYVNTDMHVSCLVCGESIKIPKGQESIGKVAICDKCRSAILKLRKMSEEESK